ncbi:HNH endonuclease [Candidatus Saccharibacteria bacterium]|nr:HNH endonuclease [Candidatus Saccharibacteria bacterium]
MNNKLLAKYKELRREYPLADYKFLFDSVPGLENLDQEIEEDDKRAEDQQIKDLKGEYWNFSSFIFQKLKKKMIFKKWAKEQFSCQFAVCAICNKPISNFHNSRVEHIVSSRNFGSNHPDNLVLVHANCKRKNGEDIAVDTTKFKENRYAERLDEYVSDLTEDTRVEYPVKFPDKIFER